MILPVLLNAKPRTSFQGKGYKLRVYESEVLKKILGAKRKVILGRRKLCIEICDVYFTNIISLLNVAWTARFRFPAGIRLFFPP
jgi:hypothetical protein